jgi:hypothetical protein
MSPPVFQDNASICDEERLFRRIHITQLVKDGDSGLVRVSSAAFRDQELSVHLEPELEREGNSAETCLRNHRNHKLVFIAAGDARRFGQSVCRDPLPEDHSHGLVYGPKKRGTIDEGLRAASAWVVPPSPPRLSDILLEKRNLGFKE